MSKKALVIEDKEEFKGHIAAALTLTGKFTQGGADLFASVLFADLGGYALPGAVVFQAEVIHTVPWRQGKTVFCLKTTNKTLDLKDGDDLQVIVAKLPEKGGKHGYDIKAQSESM